MNVTVAARHMELTDALKSYVENSLQKIRGHFEKVSSADVVLAIEKHRHIAEINVHANGIRIHGKESSHDMYASVDAVLEKLDKQVRRYKERINRHQPRVSKELRNYQYEVIGFDTPPADATAETKHHVIHREKLPMRPMSVEEAVMQLELVDDAFIVFTNAETHQVNVMYATEDGTYGLIEPQF